MSLSASQSILTILKILKRSAGIEIQQHNILFQNQQKIPFKKPILYLKFSILSQCLSNFMNLLDESYSLGRIVWLSLSHSIHLHSILIKHEGKRLKERRSQSRIPLGKLEVQFSNQNPSFLLDLHYLATSCSERETNRPKWALCGVRNSLRSRQQYTNITNSHTVCKEYL